MKKELTILVKKRYNQQELFLIKYLINKIAYFFYNCL